MLYIMRHGKTDWNLTRRLQGQTDIPLNAMGRDMAAKAGQCGRDVHLDVCYCSPLVRAVETATLFLGERSVPLIQDDRLKEMCFGVCEGDVIDLSRTERPINLFFTAPEKYVPPTGAESFDELFARTGEFLREVIMPRLAQGEDILIVGHGAMNASLICQIRQWPVAQFWRGGVGENCKLMRLA